MATSSGPTALPPTGGLYTLQPTAAGFEDESGSFKLGNLVKVLRRRRRVFLITLAAVTLAAGLRAVHERINHPVYQGGFRLLISDPVNDASRGEGANQGDIGSVARNVSRVDVPTLIEVLKSGSVLEPVYQQLSKEKEASELPKLSVSVPIADKYTAAGVLSVEANGNDPAVVQRFLQLTEKAYLAWSLDQRRAKLTEGVKFLDEQAPVLRSKSNEIQAELERFRTTHNLLQPLEEATSLSGDIQEQRKTLLNQQAERNRLMSLRNDVVRGKLTTKSFSSGSSDSIGESTSGTSVALGVPNEAQLDELNRLEAEIAKAQATYQPGTPLLNNLLAARDKLRPQLQRKELDAIDAALEQYDGSIASTRRQISQLEGRFQDQPGLLRQYEDLQRRLEIAEGNLANYLRTRDQFQLEIAQNNVPWKVIGPAVVNPNPVAPNLGLGLLQGLLLGLVAGTGAALLRDRLDHVYHSPGAVRDELKKPLLGHIPHISFFEGVRRDKRFLLKELDEQQTGLAGYQRFYYQEAFRNLYTGIRFLSSEKPIRSVALTSSVPSEGKSLVIVLIAKTLSELGKRVLLIDTDLRMPQIHQRLGIDNLEGLTNLLTEEGRSWRQLVRPVEGYDNWDVITAGRRAPDPPRLLSSTRMADLVKEIAETGGYDLVLYDTPPALGLADAALVAEQLDGILLLVSLNKVDRSLPAEAIKRIEAAGAPLLGIVTNARTAMQEADNAYTYGKGNYGYGRYGSGEPALDPSTAYQYYRNGDDTSDTESKGLAARLMPTRSNLKNWRRSLSKWTEG